MPSPFTDQFWRALADYGVTMPALGTANATWLTEYTRVRITALASVLLTACGTEGGNASGSRQFPQEVLLDALHCRRFELDPAYVLPAHLAAFPSAKIERSRPAGRNRILALPNELDPPIERRALRRQRESGGVRRSCYSGRSVHHTR